LPPYSRRANLKNAQAGAISIFDLSGDGAAQLAMAKRG
jgi:hypothetical protein